MNETEDYPELPETYKILLITSNQISKTESDEINYPKSLGHEKMPVRL